MQPSEAFPGRDRAALGDRVTGIRAVLFDFGGVLSTSPFEAFARYESENGLPEGFIRGLNARGHHENAWARLERGEVQPAEFRALFEAEARQAGHEVDALAVLTLLEGAPRPAMIEAVRRIRESYLTCLATNNYVSAGSDGVRGRMGALSELFDEVVESSRAGVRKPEPGFFEICCLRLGIGATEAVFIDDLGVNLKPAREMGMRTIKFVDEQQALSDLESALRLSLR